LIVWTALTVIPTLLSPAKSVEKPMRIVFDAQHVTTRRVPFLLETFGCDALAEDYRLQ
jgi:hypothetical protein